MQHTRRRRAAAVLTAAAAASLLAAAPADAARSGGPSMVVHARAAAMTTFDGSAAGTGPSFPATSVSARLRDCPAGSSVLYAELEQDGVPMGWATTARGAGEIECVGGEDMTVRMGFSGPSLHPGRATATFGLVQGDVLFTVTRTVRIPR